MVNESIYDEAKALERLAKGDKSAFKQIYLTYAPGLYSLGRRYLESAEQSEDMVQELFALVWQKRGDFHAVAHFRSYLFTMARNRALKQLKKIAQEAVASKEFMEQALLPDTDLQPYSDLLRRAVEHLPPQQKRVFQLVKVEGLSHEATATQLKLSPRTVNVHLVAALKFIRSQIQQTALSFVSLCVCLAHALTIF